MARVSEPAAAADVGERPVAPGHILRSLMAEQGMSQTYLAWATGYHLNHVNHVLKGYVPIHVDFALALERELGESAEFWMHRDADYWVAVARAAQQGHEA